MTDLWEPVSGVFWKTAPLLPSIGWSIDYGALFTTVVGALAGAGIGAWAAGYISERNKIREQLIKEIRDTNAAIVLALGVMNCGVGLKRQHVKSLKEEYDIQRKKCWDTIARMAAGHPQIDIPKIALLDLPEIAPPVAHLQEIVLSRLSVSGRALASFTALNDSVVNLNVALSRRNELINRFKRKDFPPGARKEHFCFGLRYGDGETNEEYGDSITGISLYTDDIIFFGSELCSDLCEHGDVLVERFNRKRLGGQTPEINKVELSAAREAGWIPPAEDYEAWTSGFKKTEKKQTARRFFRSRKRRD